MNIATTQELVDALQHEVAAVLRVPPAEVDLAQNSSLQERGVASMGALRIQFRLQERFGVLVSLTDLLDARDLQPLAEQLQRQLAGARD